MTSFDEFVQINVLFVLLTLADPHLSMTGGLTEGQLYEWTLERSGEGPAEVRFLTS